jgi:hypothetical protein
MGLIPDYMSTTVCVIIRKEDAVPASMLRFLSKFDDVGGCICEKTPIVHNM